VSKQSNGVSLGNAREKSQLIRNSATKGLYIVTDGSTVVYGSIYRI